ncbi:MAG TPA: alpha/beta hydrolase [Candidatus Paceibacterota bacterium]
MKKQIVVIHGGDTFENQETYLNFLNNYKIDIERYRTSKDDWKPGLREKLGEEYEVILPVMPNKFNARFEEWKLWLEKFFPFLNDEIILIGHSLGASFVAKYLSENKFPKKLKGVFLVSGVFDKDSEGYSLLSFSLPEKLDLQTENVYLYHSKDDPVVPFSALDNFMKAFPQAHTRVFEDRKHINQEEFPELVEDILQLTN